MIENIESLKAMMEVAAESLAGCPVRVYFRAPLRNGHKGEAFKDYDKTSAMELLPIEDVEELYKTFLHEIGHILLGHTKDLEPRNLPVEIVTAQEKGIQLLPTSTDEEHAEYWNTPQEIDARGFANYFHGFSKGKAKFFYGEDSVEACLRVCANTTIQKGE